VKLFYERDFEGSLTRYGVAGRGLMRPLFEARRAAFGEVFWMPTRSQPESPDRAGGWRADTQGRERCLVRRMKSLFSSFLGAVPSADLSRSSRSTKNLRLSSSSPATARGGGATASSRIHAESRGNAGTWCSATAVTRTTGMTMHYLVRLGGRCGAGARPRSNIGDLFAVH